MIEATNRHSRTEQAGDNVLNGKTDSLTAMLSETEKDKERFALAGMTLTHDDIEGIFDQEEAEV